MEVPMDYDITKYDRPSVAADIVVFTVRKGDSESYRHLAKPVLSVLLVKRTEEPFVDMLSLPGGFCCREETIEETAFRKLKEKTGIDCPPISLLCNLSRFGRDYLKQDEKLSTECSAKAAAMYNKNIACSTDDEKKASFLAATELYKTTGGADYSNKILDMYDYLKKCEDLHHSRYVLYGSMTYMTTRYWVDKSMCWMFTTKWSINFNS